MPAASENPMLVLISGILLLGGIGPFKYSWGLTHAYPSPAEITRGSSLSSLALAGRPHWTGSSEAPRRLSKRCCWRSRATGSTSSSLASRSSPRSSRCNPHAERGQRVHNGGCAEIHHRLPSTSDKPLRQPGAPSGVRPLQQAGI